MNGPQAIYAFKVALATVLALAFSFMLDLPNTYWALMTIPLVARPDAGSMVWRSAARLAGTLMGALVGLMLIANFAQTAGQMIAALAPWIFATSYLARLMSGTDAYAYSVAGLTALVIVLDTGSNAPAAYGYALARTTETAVAIVASFVVLLVVFPVSVENQVKGQIASARSRMLNLARADLSDEATVAIGERKAVFSELLAIHTTLRAQAFERSRRNWRLPRMTEVAVLLNRTLVAADAAAFALGKFSPAERQGRVEEERATLCRMLADYPPQRTSVEETRADVGAIERFIASLDPYTLVHHLTRTPGLIDESLPRRVAALYRLRLFAESLRDLLVAEAALLDPDTPTPRAEPISARYYNLEAAYQFGSFGSSDIGAWTTSADIGYTLDALPFSPRLGLKADAISGGGDLNDNRLGTFNPLFPKLPYFSEANLAAPANLLDIQPGISISPRDDLKMEFSWNPLWKQSKEDAFYGPPLTAVKGTAGGNSRFIGQQFIASGDWSVTERLSVSGTYVRFEPGARLKEIDASSGDYFALSTQWRF
ncbi:FUSC family protein [Jiella mangrovi]|uniref:FUSC family protein n=1 Tax=Jiella mangrovi TaxID=2821407 RepID=A0ABS4BN42_9HYPH|nr:FUSC family protein [Jiella mangrovi]MBP0617570.1 FUSC family protein [Jiella mangrovi]